MTTDIKIRWDLELLGGDLLFEDNDLNTDEGLITAVLLSWFTDQRANDDDEIPNIAGDFIDKKGWWGDLINPLVEGDESGSKLWLLSRSKTTQENITKAIEYGTRALDWMKEDGIVKNITVKGEKLLFNNAFILALKAEITKINGSKVNISFDSEWFATFADIDSVSDFIGYPAGDELVYFEMLTESEDIMLTESGDIMLTEGVRL